LGLKLKVMAWSDSFDPPSVLEVNFCDRRLF